MDRMNYTVITVSTKRIKCIWDDMYFDNRESAERYAEGISAGLSMVEKKYGVILLLNGEYNHKTAIHKNTYYKHIEILYRDYVWPREVLAGAI